MSTTTLEFRSMRPDRPLLAAIVLFVALLLLSGSTYAAITARVTINTYAAFATNNSGNTPGMIMFLRSNSPPSGGSYDQALGWTTISGNVTNLAVDLGTTPGYFATVFNHNGAAQASGCTTSPIDFFTATGYIANGGTFDVTITCTVPDTTGPVAQSAATNTAGTSVTISFDENIDSFSDATASDFSVTANSTPVAVSGVSFSGTTATLALSGTIYSGQTVKVGHSLISGGGVYDDSYNQTAAFSNLSVTNNSTASAAVAPSVTTGAASSVSASGATLNGTVNDNGGATTVTFDWGTTTGYGTNAAATTGGTVGAGAGNTAAAVSVTGLTCNTTYHFRIKGTNSGGTTNGSDQTFTTSACVPGAPTSVSATAGNAQASVTFTAPASNGGSAVTSYTATANPGGATGNCAGPAACPITVTGLTNGTAYTFTVTATNGAGTGSASAASGSVTPKAPQTITFTNPGAQNFGTTPTLTATTSSGLTPAFTSSTTGVCTITSGGALTFVTAGTCTINADQAGNGSYTAASTVTQSFTVNAVAPGAPTIGTATAGDTQASVTFSAPASNGGSAIISYTATANPGGATGSCAGPSACTLTVTGLTNGTAYTFTVTATNATGTGSASAASNSATPKANQTITFTNPGAQNFGTTPTLSATATSSLTPTFTSATTGVCTITSGGALTFVTAGTCTINADQAGNGSFNAATTVSRSFTVNAITPGAPTIGTATAGDTQASITFSAPASNGGASITGYTATANPGGATGTSAGGPITVTGLTNGVAYTFTVTATNAAGTGSASSASNSATPKASQTITFANPGTQNFGTTPTLTATSDSGLTPSFTSATTGVCTITSGGALTFVTTGTCTINADQAGSGSFLAASQVSRSFTVAAVVPSAPTGATATAGDTMASVAFSAPAFTGGSAITGYTVTSNPGGITGTGASSPISVTGLTNGVAYTFTVTATNSAGTGSASTASNSVTPEAGPAVTSVAVPANGSYGVGRNLDFTVTWDQNVNVTGTPQIALVIGATTVQATYVSSPTPTTTLFRYTVLAGQLDANGITVGALTLNGGTIQSSSNINATLTLNSVASTAAVLVETTAPTLPAANIVVNNQADPHKIVLTFSENLDGATLGTAGTWTVTANGGSPVYTVNAVSLASGNQVTLTLAAVNLADNKTYLTNTAANAHLKVTPPATLADIAGNTYAAGLVTEAGATHVLDSTAPTLSAVGANTPTTTGGTLAATASEKAMGYWIAIATGGAAPTPAQVKAGANYGAVTVVAKGSGALPSGTAGSMTMSGLVAGTPYNLHVVAEDAAGNLSTAVSNATLTTASEATSTGTVVPSGGATTSPSGGATVTISSNGSSGSTINLPPPTTGTGSTTPVVAPINVILPDGSTMVVAANTPNTALSVQLVTQPGNSQPIAVFTVTSGSATLTSPTGGHPILSLQGGATVTTGSGNGQCTTRVVASRDADKEAIQVDSCFVTLSGGSFSSLGGNGFSAVKDGVLYSGETAEFDRNGKITAAYLGTRQGDSATLAGDNMLMTTNGLKADVVIPRLSAKTSRLGETKLDDALFQTINKAFGTTLATPQQSTEGVLIFQRGADMMAVIPIGRVRIDTARADGLTVTTAGVIEVAAGGYVASITPSVSSPNDLAGRLGQLWPGSSTTLLGSGGYRVTTANGHVYVGRPAWTVSLASPGMQAFIPARNGNVLFSNGTYSQILFPDFVDYANLENTFRTGLNDPQLSVQPNMDGTATATVLGRQYRLLPNWEVIKPSDGITRPAWWSDNGVIFVKYPDGTAQGFTVQ